MICPGFPRQGIEGGSMLRGIPECIGSDLLKILFDMGHGDTIVIADHFYPAVSKTPSGRVVEAKGVGAIELMDAILTLMPLDAEYCEQPFQHIVPDPDSGIDVGEPELWKQAEALLEKHGYKKENIGTIPRSDFYETAKKGYATVSTSETQTYGCFILQKGVK